MLPRDEIHVWAARIPAGIPPVDSLSPEERRRAGALRREADRRRFAGSRRALREILAAYAGVLPGEIAFSAACARCGSEGHGKPRLAHPAGAGIEFNASRSGDLAVVALARGHRVGVDVELLRADFAFDEIASRFFAPAERTDLDAPAFFASWTRKEAILKLTGEGLAGDLSMGLPPGTWTAPLHLADGYAGALAADAPACRVVVRFWEGNPLQ